MSYILEALKKSERERARGNIPTLETATQQGVSHKFLWLGILLGAGTLLLLLAIAWFINLQFFRSPGPAGDGTAAGAPASAPAESTAAGTGTETSVEIRSSRTPTDSETGDASRSVTNMNELDADARRRIEGLSVNVVSYSDVPERRFVMLNQRIVRESETVGDGVVVKRITREGALLSVGDYEILISPD